MFIIKYYIAGALLALLLAVISPFLILKVGFGWIALSMAAVSSAYVLQKPSIFRKKQNGSIPLYSRWLFVPFLLGVQIYNLWSRKNDKVPAIQQIEDKLFLACRLFSDDVLDLQGRGVKAILDVTAEFDGLDWSAQDQDLAYLNVPVLDHQSPQEEELVHAIHWIQNQISAGRAVTVHCALGRGRSVLVVAAYLLAKYQDLSVEDALSRINDIRQTAALNHTQLKALKKYYAAGILKLSSPIWVIANPVSGGGKWQEYREQIEQNLAPHFQLHIEETTQEVSASMLAKKAIEQGATTLVACGGDGTLSEVAAEIVGTDLTLGIIPLGTANALAHVLFGTKSKVLPIETACEHIVAKHVQTIDTASCNDKLVLLVVGLGFEQQMIKSADRDQKNEGGQFAYLKGLWDAVHTNETQHLRVSIDQQEEQSIEASSFIVANAAPFATVLAQGGGSPNYQDGLLDITWMPQQDNPNDHLLTMSELAISGLTKEFKSENVKYLTAKQIIIRAEHRLSYVVDGENAEADELVIKINPNSLNVLSLPLDNADQKAT
ncbi:MAG: dual specificity protein phosphatase family protein [Paraglaciecola sp.]|nr:dual specificity protein phosphatase family protein [Paraglaciecola sp.]